MNLLTIQERAANIMKNFQSDIIKGGEGSRGGKVIGHTKSGKPIYANKDYDKYSDFNEHDHNDASEIHTTEKNKYKRNSKKHDDHSWHASLHRQYSGALKHSKNKKAIKEVEKKTPKDSTAYAKHNGFVSVHNGQAMEFDENGKHIDTKPSSFYPSGGSHGGVLVSDKSKKKN